MIEEKFVVCNLAVMMAKRKIKSITQLCEMTGLSRKSLEKCYHKKAVIMNYDTTVRLCKALNCTIGDLYSLVNKAEYEKVEKRKEEREKALNKGYIYFILNEANGLIKIGRSADVENRLYQLQYKTGQPLRLLKKIPSDSVVQQEKELHELYSNKRIHGEWFDITEEDINIFKPKVIAE